MIRRIVIALLVLALAGAVLGAITWAYEAWRSSVFTEGERAGAATVQKLWDEDRAQAQAAAMEQAHQSAAETLRRLNKQRENDLAQEAILARMRRDRDAAVAAADGLRQRASAYLDAAGCGQLSGDAATACVRQAAAAIGDALGRCAAIAQRAAAAADDARARGLRCEAEHDALTAPAAP